MSDTPVTGPTPPTRRAFLRLIGAAPAVGWIVASCGDAAVGAAADTAPGTGDGASDGAGGGADALADAGAGDTAAPDSGGRTDAATADTAAGADTGPGDSSSSPDTAPDATPDGSTADVASDAAITDAQADADAAPADAAGPADASLADAAPPLDVAEDVAPPTCDPTGGDLEGPYYIAGAPDKTVLAGPNEPGDRLFVSGTVRSSGTCAPLAQALVDVWQADASGKYHSDTKEWRLRGVMLTGPQGQFAFETIVPGHYPQSGSWRPKHIHFMVSAPGHIPVTTQLYWEGDPYLQPNDPCASCQSDDETHIVALVPTTPDGPPFECTFEVALRPVK